MILGGIDEAGYGPKIGPLVLAASVFAVEETDLYAALAPEVGRADAAAGAGAALLIDDSKCVYRGRGDLARLERTVLAAVACADASGAPPATVGELLARLGADPDGEDPGDTPWYEGIALQTLPRAADPADLARATAGLRAALDRAGVGSLRLLAAVVREPAFNRLCARTGNKARAHWRTFSRLLDGALAGPPVPAAARIVSDRHGGRAYYGDLLAEQFLFAPIGVLHESPERSEYEVAPAGGPRLRIRFEVDADAGCLEVALASCVAKYLRELHVEALNAFFAAHRPQLRPTAGYGTDANRYIDEVRPIMKAQGIPMARLVRAR